MILILLALATSHVSDAKNDRACMDRLHQLIVQRSDKKAWFVRFEREIPPTDIPTFQRMQKQSPPNSRAYAESSFALAYYGIDYDANLKRVMRPNTIWYENIKQYGKEYHGDYDGADINCWGNVGVALNLLYLKRHDLKSLGMWLEMPSDGAPAESNDGELADLWKRHSLDMLKAAAGHRTRIKGIAEALWFDVAGGDKNEPAQVRKQIQKVKRLTLLNDRTVATTAEQVALEIARFEEAQHRSRK